MVLKYEYKLKLMLLSSLYPATELQTIFTLIHKIFYMVTSSHLTRIFLIDVTHYH